jgi:hypothetical protein
MPEETEIPETPDASQEPSQAARESLKGLVKEAFAEYIEENKPSPQRTKRAPNFLDQIFGM